jgi:hypothetical protein
VVTDVLADYEQALAAKEAAWNASASPALQDAPVLGPVRSFLLGRPAGRLRGVHLDRPALRQFHRATENRGQTRSALSEASQFQGNPRLQRYHAGRYMNYDNATPADIATAITSEIGRHLDYRPVATDGAARAAALLADLL